MQLNQLQHTLSKQGVLYSSPSIPAHVCTSAAEAFQASAGVTPDPLDHGFVWQLYDVLQAVEAVATQDSIGHPPAQVSFLVPLLHCRTIG